MELFEALHSLWPNGDSRIAGLRAGINASAGIACKKYGITSDLVFAHFMAQISHECGAGTAVVENLNYSAPRLMQVWPSHFNTANARQYAHNSKALANFIYNPPQHRDLGNLGGNDGYNFRGRGAVQTTGRHNYTVLAQKTGLDLVNNPDLIIDPLHFIECGAADFAMCGCIPHAEKDDVVGVSAMLNVGHLVDAKYIIGLAERRIWLKRWKGANVLCPTVA